MNNSSDSAPLVLEIMSTLSSRRGWPVQAPLGDFSTRSLLLRKYLRVALAVWIEAIFFAALPRGLQLGTSDVPIGAAFLQHRSQILAKFFDRRPGKIPIAVIDFEYDEPRFEHEGVRNHR